VKRRRLNKSHQDYGLLKKIQDLSQRRGFAQVESAREEEGKEGKGERNGNKGTECGYMGVQFDIWARSA